MSGDGAEASYRNLMLVIFIIAAVGSIMFHILIEEKPLAFDDQSETNNEIETNTKRKFSTFLEVQELLLITIVPNTKFNLPISYHNV